MKNITEYFTIIGFLVCCSLKVNAQISEQSLDQPGAGLEFQFEDDSGQLSDTDPEVGRAKILSAAAATYRNTAIVEGDAINYGISVTGAVVGSISPEYFLNDFGPISCATGDGCKLYSIGGLVSQRFYNDTAATNAPITIKALIYYNGTLAETVPMTVSSSSNGLYYVSADLKSDRLIDAPNQIHIRLMATTTFIGSSFDWPTLNSFALSLGYGLNLATSQAVPDAPSAFSLTGSTTNRLLFVSSTVSTNKRVGGTANSLTTLEVQRFEYYHKVTTVDVDMATYKKIYTTSSAVATGGIRTVGLIRSTSVPSTRANVYYPNRGMFRTYFRAIDYENKVGNPRSMIQKVNTFQPPRYLTYSVDTLNKKIRVGFRSPLTYQDGTPIAAASYKGYLISLRNKATGAIVYSYRVPQVYDANLTRYYTTPNRLPTGTYNVETCGWSSALYEGLCTKSGDLIIP